MMPDWLYLRPPAPASRAFATASWNAPDMSGAGFSSVQCVAYTRASAHACAATASS